MRRKLMHGFLAIIMCLSALAQSREVTNSGVSISDAAGRVVRVEGTDGIVVRYLYDTAKSEEPSGIAVSPTPTLTLTVPFEIGKGITLAGLPTLTSLLDDQGRTRAVQANRRTVALIDYTSAGFVSAVTVPARLRWNISAPNAAGHLLQTVEDATGRVIASCVVTAVDGVRREPSYEAATAEFEIDGSALTYELSATAVLTTARHQNGDVAFYVVHGPGCDVGFAVDGTPRFYDLALSVFHGTIAPGGDLVVSPTWDAQHLAVPNHLVLTAGNAVGLYVVEGPAEKAIVAAWTSGDGRTCGVRQAVAEPEAEAQ